MPDSLLFNQPQEIIRNAGDQYGPFAQYALWVAFVAVIILATIAIRSWNANAREKKRLQDVVISHLDRVSEAQEKDREWFREELERRVPDNRSSTNRQGGDS